MADCPKCGRTLTAAGSCIKCGVIQDRSKWYAIADEAEAAEPKSSEGARAKSPPRAKANAKRDQWYEAAGERIPDDDALAAARAGKLEGEVPLSDDPHAWAEVSRGRKDPPFLLIGVGVVFVLVFGAIFWSLSRGSAPAPAPVASLPAKNIQWNRSYGYKVIPPDGFKQQVVPMPEFARGVHGTLTAFVSYRNAESGVEGYYFGEVKDDTNLDSYAQLSTSQLGTVTPVTTIPEGMKAYPTKGFLIDMGARKALVYVAFAKPDRYLTAWVMAPAAAFAKHQSAVESAARAFHIVDPDGPRPGSSFAPQDP